MGSTIARSTLDPARKSFKKARKAREYYEKAAQYPHPSKSHCADAMAELAKVSLHGYGGLEQSFERAKLLAEQALKVHADEKKCSFAVPRSSYIVLPDSLACRVAPDS